MERKITDLQKELNKEIEVNEALHKEVHLLSELKSLPSEIEMLKKEVNIFKQITLILKVKLNRIIYCYRDVTIIVLPFLSQIFA